MNLFEAFEHQAKSCAALDSPLTAAILRGFADHFPAQTKSGQMLLAWPGDVSGKGDSLPLRVAGGFHYLHRAEIAPELAPIYTSGAGAMGETLAQVFTTHDDWFHDWLQSPPQTNEIRRSAGLIAASNWLTHRLGRMLVLSELGASAGLNLLFEFYRLDIAGHPPYGCVNSEIGLSPDWIGDAPPHAPPYIHEAAGCDLRPIDLVDPAQQERLFAYLWADQPERIARTRAAIKLNPPCPVGEDALSWLPPRLHAHQSPYCHLIYSTIAWQYFPEAVQNSLTKSISARGAAASAEAPQAWLRIEADENPRGAWMQIQIWGGGPVQHWSLGRMDFHGRWVEWDPQQID